MRKNIPHPVLGTIEVLEGPGLLASVPDGPALPAHVARYGPLPTLRTKDLVAMTESVEIRGRGGAGFPFSRKLTTMAETRGRNEVVVNLSEGEPASLKDAALVQTAPHLILDGAVVTARALGAKDVHLVLPGESGVVGHVVRRALAERAETRRDGRLSWRLHDAADRFVAGQAMAVLELMSGRPNLPVTTWKPAAIEGHRGRPTMLSNAETFAHVGRLALVGVADYGRHGTAAEPGTTLLTIDGDVRQEDGQPAVLEVGYGTAWSQVLPAHRLASPVLLGGYHGTWVPGGELTRRHVSPADLKTHGWPLGAGVVLPLDEGCPVTRTSQIVSYLASQSARRCGPCVNGLPALASAVSAMQHGSDGLAEVERLAAMVERRGACAHPDGTIRLVRSLIAGFEHELELHAKQGCGFAPWAVSATWEKELSA